VYLFAPVASGLSRRNWGLSALLQRFRSAAIVHSCSVRANSFDTTAHGLPVMC
jgi:hypothetical protein